jgi:anti-sigma regulatory factor (Ser/Thr protein kinase)
MNNKIKIASKIENISVVENLIDEISEKHKLGTEVYGNILIAIVEAVTNCIIHGNKLDASKSVFVSYELLKEKIQFNIKDEGDGFDYKDVPDPTQPVNVEKPHGRGVFLMMHLSDELEFNTEGTEVIMRFKI